MYEIPRVGERESKREREKPWAAFSARRSAHKGSCINMHLLNAALIPFFRAAAAAAADKRRKVHVCVCAPVLFRFTKR